MKKSYVFIGLENITIWDGNENEWWELGGAICNGSVEHH